MWFLIFEIICQKVINNEDNYFELYCEEVKDPTSAPHSTCQQIVTGGESPSYTFHCHSKMHTM